MNVYAITNRNIRQLTKRETRKALERFADVFKTGIPDINHGVLEVVNLNNITLYMAGKKPVAASNNDALFPILTVEELLKRLPSLTVDMGAVPHICDGSDVMAPGVTAIEGEFDRGSIAVVRDKNNGKAIAIARTLMKSTDMKQVKRGKVAENLHYIGDRIWKITKAFKRT